MGHRVAAADSASTVYEYARIRRFVYLEDAPVLVSTPLRLSDCVKSSNPVLYD